MKKVLAMLLALAMVMALAACGGKTQEDTTAAPEADTSAVVEDTTAAPAVEDTTAAPVAEDSTAAEGESTPAEDTTAAKAPETKAEILEYYNKTLAAAYDAKVGFEKERTTDNENMDAGVALKTFKGLVYEFMGIGSENKYTENVTKGKWETETKKHYLRKSTLTEADLTNATITSDGKNYTIVLNIKNGSSKGAKTGSFNNSPIDKSGMCVGDEDKSYFDHKTGLVIYDAIDDTFAGADIQESYSNGKATAVVDIATGNLVKLAVEYDISCAIDIGIGTGTATGTTHIIYKNFKY